MSPTTNTLRGLRLALIGLSILPSVFAATNKTYHFIKEIPVGGEGGWDYLSVDEGSRRLYLSHATKVVVIDIDKDTVVGEVSDTPGVHGFVAAPKTKHGFSSNGREGKASIVDLDTLKTISKIPTGENPDAILYEAGQNEVYTFNGRGKSATVFSAEDGKAVATIPLAGKPEFSVADPKSGHVFVNIEDKNSVAQIDTKTHAVVATWSLAPGESPTGLAFDVAHHRLFAGCDNSMIAVMNSEDGKVVATIPAGEGIDATAFDAGTGLVFSSNGGSGTVTVAHEDSPDNYTVVQTLETAKGARTMTLDPKTHRIYLAAAQYEPQPESKAGEKRSRPKMVAGSFKVLVYGMD